MGLAMLKACLTALLVLPASAQLMRLQPADMLHTACLVSVIPTPLYRVQTADSSVRYRTALNLTMVLTRHNGAIEPPWTLSLAGPYLAVASDVDLNLVNVSLSNGESCMCCPILTCEHLFACQLAPALVGQHLLWDSSAGGWGWCQTCT